MTLSDLASIAIVAQGIFFIISIALVLVQLRANTKLVRAANSQKLVELSSPFNLQLAQDRTLMELWWRATQGFDQMDEIDQARYYTLLTWWLTLHESIYHQWRSRLIDPETFASWTRDLEFWTDRQQVRRHWPQLSGYFEVSFSRHLTQIIARMEKEAA